MIMRITTLYRAGEPSEDQSTFIPNNYQYLVFNGVGKSHGSDRKYKQIVTKAEIGACLLYRALLGKVVRTRDS